MDENQKINIPVSREEQEELSRNTCPDCFSNPCEGGWTDPAGGYHACGESDPAKQYE